MRRFAILRFVLLTAVASASAGGLRPSAEAAPLAVPSLGLIPASGPAGMTITAVGSGWTFGNAPYVIYWEVKGGTQLGTFSPDGPGNWSTSITIPGGASAGPHSVVACEGSFEFEQCASATFTVVPPTATVTPTRTRTPTLPPGVTPAFILTPTFTPTRTPTPLSGCRDELIQVSPRDYYADLGGVAAADLVLDVILTDPATSVVRVYTANIGSALYTQWPDPLPGTTVDAEPDPTDPNRWRLTVRDFPVRLGYNQIGVDISPTCGWSQAYFQFYNGDEPTPTLRPDACGGLGLPTDNVITFDGSSTEGYQTIVARDYGVRFERSMQLLRPREISPRSSYGVGASIEAMEFGSAMLPIRMAFDRPLSALGVFVGMEEAMYVTGEVTASLIVYGYRPGSDELVRLGADSTTFPAAATDVVHCLKFEAAEGALIAWALVEYADSGGGSIAERRIIDDLTLVYAEAELPPDAPPVVEITAPADRASVPGTTVHLRATIREDVDLERVAFQIDGGPETRLGAWPSATDPTAYFTGITFSTAIMEPGRTHLLTVTAYDGAGHFAQDTVTVLVPTPVPTIDIQAVKLEAVQVVQCLDNDRCADNAVPMVLGKPTWVRVYVRAEGGVPRNPISGRLCRGRVATCDSGMVLPVNEITPDADEDPVANDRASLEASLNFIVPPAWLAEGTLELTAFVNYREEDLDEIRTDNNVVQASVRVVPARALTVMFSQVTVDGLTPPLSEMWVFADWLARVFPVARITAVGRAPLPGNLDLSDTEGGGCGRSWNRLLDALRAAYVWSGGGTPYYLGLVPNGANTGGVIGCGEMGGRISASITSGGTRWGPIVGAQELGHNFGRRHATTCGNADNPDPAYPRRDGLLDDMGFDTAIRQLYPRDSSYDYMGYCGGPDNTWTSVHTYLSLLSILPRAEAAPSAARLAAPYVADGVPSLVGGGQISPDGFTLERGFYRASLAEDIEDGLPLGPYTVHLRDAAGAVVYARDFGVIPLSNDEPSDSGFVQIILPDLPEVAEIVFLYNTSEIGRVSASGSPPQVAIVEPAGGEDWGDSGVHTIGWQASDADGDALRFNIQVSADGGASWSSLAVDVADATSLSVDSANLPGGNLLFRVLASDGLNTSQSATASAVTVGAKPPLVHIGAPADGDWVPAGEAVVFRGYATDIEDLVVDDGAFVWSSDRDGELGRGPTLWGLPLSAGDHLITLTVTDRSGASASQTVRISVGTPEAAGPARPPLALLLVALGGLLLLGSIGGIAFYLMKSRRA